MLHQVKTLLTDSRMVCTGVVVLAIVVMSAHPTHSKSLDKPACEALKNEHQTLLETGIKDDIGRGHEWAKEHLGQLRMDQIGRLFEIEEQIAFRCKGVALTTAVVIPSLRSVKPPKKKALARKSAKELRRRGIKRSRIPGPVRRPTLAPVQNAPQKIATTPPTEKVKAKVGAAKGDPAKLPKVIRLQTSKTSPANAAGSNKARRIKARQAKARRIRARKARQRRQRSDAYVPPPASPGYQPSLNSP